MRCKAKVSTTGLKYYALDKEDVIELNEGVQYMQWVKGKLSLDENIKYLLLPGTGSLVLQGTISESDDDILNDIGKHLI